MEDNILDDIGITPFPPGDDEEDFSPPQKRPTSIRLGDATRRQIDQLIKAGHGNQSEVITLAVYGMWRIEVKNDEEFAEYIIRSMAGDLACGAGLLGDYPWEEIDEFEKRTGRDLYKEAMKFCT